MYTGVLNAFQRIDYLLRAFAVALREKPDALLLVVSPLVSETHEREYRRLAAELGIADSVIWISPHTLKDFPSYLALADVASFPGPNAPVIPSSSSTTCWLGPIVSFAGGAKGSPICMTPTLCRITIGRHSARGLSLSLRSNTGSRTRSQRARHGPGQLRLAADLREDRVHLRQTSGGASVHLHTN